MNIDEETLSQLKRELPMAYVPKVDLLTIDTMDISSLFYALEETLPPSKLWQLGSSKVLCRAAQ
jgi:hypothetical protein